jgi:hypothetical protein
MSDEIVEIPAAVTEWLIANPTFLLQVYLSGMKGGIASALNQFGRVPDALAGQAAQAAIDIIVGDPIAMEQTRTFVIDAFVHQRAEADMTVIQAHGRHPAP